MRDLDESPLRSQRGGVRAAPTPAGVPVRIMSPGSSVRPWLIHAISVGTSNDELACVRRLHDLAVDARLDRQPGREIDLVEAHDLGAERAERVERLRPRELPGRVLMVTRRHVVRDREPGDVLERVGRAPRLDARVR